MSSVVSPAGCRLCRFLARDSAGYWCSASASDDKPSFCPLGEGKTGIGMAIDRVSVAQDDEGEWWVQFYVDDVRHGYSIREILRVIPNSPVVKENIEGNKHHKKVEIRGALVIDSEGNWSLSGWGNSSGPAPDYEMMDTALEGCNDYAETDVRYWITLEEKVPEPPAPREIGRDRVILKKAK